MIEQYLDLFRRCFSKATHYSSAYLRWLYADNPAGEVVGFDAFEDGRLAAHYACVPAPIMLDGRLCRGLLSLNTATDPAHQGKGLFVRLATLTYDKAAADGFDAVFGVANANSTPGFVRRLGFQRVCSLRAEIGCGPLAFDPVLRFEAKASFRRHWTADMLAWRAANPANPLFMHGGATRTSFSARTSMPGLVCWSERAVGPVATATPHPAHAARLFLGAMPRGVATSPFYVAIPRRLRPSPLNLIYRALSPVRPGIDAEGVFFDFLDFDAF